MKVWFQVFRATSLWVQAQLIKRCLEQYGAKCRFVKSVTVYDIIRGSADAYIFVAVANPTWLLEYASTYDLIKRRTHCKALLYTTIEGIPYPYLAQQYGVKYAEYIANSHFTKKCLESVGWKVIDVIHHAYDPDGVKKAIEKGQVLRRKVKRDFKDRVVFLYVGRDDHRKQLDRLMKAVDILNQKCPNDFVLLCWTELRRPQLFRRQNVKVCGIFGSRPHVDVLALMYACDYHVFPTVCEGFGVPLLEAQAVGRPTVHCWFPPLSEFSLKEANFTFPYDHVEYWKTTAEQYFQMHMYDPAELADAMIRAIDIYKNYPSEYEDRCKKLAEHAKKWDYRKVYRKFAVHLGLAKPVEITIMPKRMNKRQLFGKQYFEGGLSNYKGYTYAKEWAYVAKELTEVFQLKGKRVLDVGCAYGYLVNELKKQGVIAVGIDISDYAMKKAREAQISDILHADALHLPFKDKSFYCVIAFELVEHIPREFEAQLLRELVRVSQKYILVRTPYWKDSDDKDKTHVNIRPASYWIRAFEGLGCRFNIDLYMKYHFTAVYKHPKFADDCLVFEVS